MTNTSQLSREIFVRSKNGDLKALRLIVEHYQYSVFSLAFRLLADEEDAKDVTQECFIRVWKHLSSYNPNKKFMTWIYRIVTNLCYDRMKAKSRRNKIFCCENDISNIYSITKDCELNSNINNTELTKIIETLADKLTPKQRTVFILRDLQGLTVNEVSEIIEMSIGAVKTNLCYARQYIREKLNKINY